MPHGRQPAQEEGWLAAAPASVEQTTHFKLLIRAKVARALGPTPWASLIRVPKFGSTCSATNKLGHQVQ
jgi:hypothetical protein